MFGVFRAKPNYEKIFSSQDEIKKLIYSDRTKTSSILGSNGFIEAWLESPQIAQVTAVISNEAMNGDIPSLKQMIWLLNLYYEDAPNKFKNKEQLTAARTSYLQDRIKFCQKAIDCGLADQSYYAMTSSVNLYSMHQHSANSMDNPIVQRALLGIVVYAEIFLKSGASDAELIMDAKNAIAHYSHLANLLAKMYQR